MNNFKEVPEFDDTMGSLDVDSLPCTTEFGGLPDQENSIQSSKKMANSSTSLSLTAQSSSSFKIVSEGKTKPNSILYTVTAQTKLQHQMGNGSWLNIATGPKTMRVGLTASSSATITTDKTGIGGVVWRGISQHSVSYGSTLDIASTQETKVF